MIQSTDLEIIIKETKNEKYMFHYGFLKNNYVSSTVKCRYYLATYHYGSI